MAIAFSIKESKQREVEIKISGKLDDHTLAMLENTLRNLRRKKNTHHILINLEKGSFISARETRKLKRLLNKSKEKGSKIKVIQHPK